MARVIIHRWDYRIVEVVDIHDGGIFLLPDPDVELWSMRFNTDFPFIPVVNLHTNVVMNIPRGVFLPFHIRMFAVPPIFDSTITVQKYNRG